jgi:hypothetical protein
MHSIFPTNRQYSAVEIGTRNNCPPRYPRSIFPELGLELGLGLGLVLGLDLGLGFRSGKVIGGIPGEYCPGRGQLS